MFVVIFMYGNLFLRIAGKPQKLEPAKISCHMVDRPTRLAILHSFIFIQIVSGSLVVVRVLKEYFACFVRVKHSIRFAFIPLNDNLNFKQRRRQQRKRQ